MLRLCPDQQAVMGRKMEDLANSPCKIAFFFARVRSACKLSFVVNGGLDSLLFRMNFHIICFWLFDNRQLRIALRQASLEASSLIWKSFVLFIVTHGVAKQWADSVTSG